MKARGILLLRISVGVIFVWFGMLKFVPELSPAEQLAGTTVQAITFGLLSFRTGLLLLAVWEVGLGVLLIFGWMRRFAVLLLLLHMAGTFTPVVFFPQLTFTELPYGLTLTGQYIMKNIVIVCAALVIHSHSHSTTSNPSVA